jgi:hypothetical protein
MKLKSKLETLEGTLLVQKIYKDGSIETVVNDPNMIMLSSKQYILSTCYATSGTFDPINTLKVGVGGTVDPDGLYPKAVTQNLLTLFNTLLTVSTSYTVNNTVPSVTFISDLDQGTGNGSLITEAGLFRQSGVMFNIKTFPGIPKTSEFSLHFEWTIKIA